MKILLLDDHTLFRAGLKLLLQALDARAETLEAGTIEQALALVSTHPDLQLCLLDISLRNENGLAIIGAIKSARPDAVIVIVSGLEEAAPVRAALDAGAMSFIPKSATPDAFAEALRHVLAGEIYLPERLFDSQADPESALSLSRRQRDVLRGLCRGKTTKSIARDLALSEHTVKEYIADLFKLLEVHNRTEAVIKAGRMKLTLDSAP